MTKFSNKSNKPHLWPSIGPFSPFLEQKKNSGSVTHNTRASNAMLSFKKANEPIPRKLPDRKNGSTEGQTLIHRTLLATATGPKKFTSSY